MFRLPLDRNVHLLTLASQLKSITVSPDPPVPGKNLTVNVEADVLETIEVSLQKDCFTAFARSPSYLLLIATDPQVRLPPALFGFCGSIADFQEGAYADVTVKLGLIKLLQKTFDVCEEA